MRTSVRRRRQLTIKWKIEKKKTKKKQCENHPLMFFRAVKTYKGGDWMVRSMDEKPHKLIEEAGWRTVEEEEAGYVGGGLTPSWNSPSI